VSVEAEFLEKLERSGSLRYGTIYRATMKWEHVDGNKRPQLNYSEIHEVLPPDRWRTVEVTVKNNKARKIERIGDNSTFYERIDGGPWQMYRGGTGADIGGLPGKTNTTYKYRGAQTVAGKLTVVYEVQEERVSDDAANGNSGMQENRVTKYWFLKDGRLLRSIQSRSVRRKPGTVRLTIMYEYEPKDLHFELPTQ